MLFAGVVQRSDDAVEPKKEVIRRKSNTRRPAAPRAFYRVASVLPTILQSHKSYACGRGYRKHMAAFVNGGCQPRIQPSRKLRLSVMV